MADIFLSLEGVRGESLDAMHRDDIEIHQMSWGVYNTAPVKLSESEASRQGHADHLDIGKWVDNATPTLTRMCALGKHIPKGSIVCRKNAGDRKVEYLRIDLEDVKVDRVAWGSRAEETLGIQETVRLSFLKFTIKYVLQRADGIASGANEFSFKISDQNAMDGGKGGA